MLIRSHFVVLQDLLEAPQSLTLVRKTEGL